MRSFRLLKRRNFTLLWLGGLISITGDWVLRIGLPISIYQLTGSILATSAMFVAGILPSLLFGSVAGVYVDRWDRRRVVIVGNVLLAVGLVPLAFVTRAELVWIAYVVQFVEVTILQFTTPAEHALLPAIVQSEDLVAANALTAFNRNVSRLAGPAIGGVVALSLGIAGIAIADALSFLAAAILVGVMRGIAVAPRVHVSVDQARALGRIWQEWLAGLAVIRDRRSIAVIFLAVAIAAVGEGVFSVLFVVYVVTIIGGGPHEIGLLQSSQGLGGLVASVGLVALSARVGPAALVGWSAVLFGLVDLAIFNAPAAGVPFALIVILFGLVGIVGAPMFPAIYSIIQSAVPDGFRGRVLGAMSTTASLLQLVGLAIAGFLAVPLGTITVLNVQGIGYVATGLVLLALLPRALAGDRASPRPVAESYALKNDRSSAAVSSGASSTK